MMQSQSARTPRGRGRLLLVASLICMAVPANQSLADDLPRWSPALDRIFSGKPPRDAADLLEMQSYLQAVSQKAIDATVSIRYGLAHGSGVIVSEDGMILTAAHVISPRNQRALVRLSDGRQVRAKPLGRHLALDACMLKLEGEGPWPYLPTGKSSQVKQGHWCVATGHPGGFVADRGPVVRLGRVLEYDRELMRTDCRLSGGDSGGPLIDMRGQVIGIHSRIGTSLANNLHIPISIYLRHWEGLARGEQWEGSSYLGVVQATGSGGAIVGRVRDDSPADRAGIQSDDIILRFGGQRVFSFDQLRQLVQMRRPGEEVEIDLIRRGKSLKLDVRIGKRPVPPDRPTEE